MNYYGNPREFLKEYATTYGADALQNIAPVALGVRMVPGYKATDENALYEPSMVVYPMPHPVLSAIMERAGAAKMGAMSWRFGNGEEPNFRAVIDIVRAVRAGNVQGQAIVANRKGAHDLSEVLKHRRHETYWLNDLKTTALWTNRLRPDAARHAMGHFRFSGNDASSFGVVALDIAPRMGYVRVYTHKLEIPQSLRDEIGDVDLNLRPAPRMSRKEPTPLRPAHACALLEWAASAGFTIVDADGSNATQIMRQRLAHSIVAWARPGRPAQAQVSIGSQVATLLDVPKKETKDLVVTPRSYAMHHVNHSANKIIDILGDVPTASRLRFASSTQLSAWSQLDVPLCVHPAVADTARLASATPVDDERLFDYQREAVGRHLATQVGYANVSRPGAGKTVMVLEAMRRRSENIDSYRGLIIAEANVRSQFAREARLWFPHAEFHVVEKGEDATALQTALDAQPTHPVVVITSYALASRAANHITKPDTDQALRSLFEDVVTNDEVEGTFAHAIKEMKREEALVALGVTATGESITPVREEVALDGFFCVVAESVLETGTERVDIGAVLLATHWHDIVADEAACLRNHSSRQSKALWALRENADIAVALTGTPISKGLDDLGRIISWVRADRHLFHKAALSDTFDLSKEEDVEEFQEAIGPVLFRCDRSAFADKLPPVGKPQVIRVVPTPAEAHLANVALHELRRVYDELLAWLNAAEGLDKSSPEYREVMENLTAARHAWAGGTTIARMAASDPISLRSSHSAAAALLEAQGLVEAAIASGGSKRRRCVEECIVRIANGERILIFTEFASVATTIISDLRASGLRVGEILGGGGKKRDRMIEEFAQGHLDVMVSTSAGKRGLNLQTATTLIHYDLPWAADDIEQRHGRVERVGSTAKEIQIIFMLCEGTIEERIAAVVAARSLQSAQALDVTRGVAIQDTDAVRTMSALINDVDIDLVAGSDASLLEMTRVILATA